MINTNEFMERFAEEFKKKYGENERLDAGDCCIAVMNNCAAIIELDENKKFSLSFIPDMIKIDERG